MKFTYVVDTISHEEVLYKIIDLDTNECVFESFDTIETKFYVRALNDGTVKVDEIKKKK